MINSILLHIPHSSTVVPNSFGKITNDVNDFILNHTDFYTKEIFEFNDVNIKTLSFDYNRVFCDVERYWDDVNEIMSIIGQGAYYIKLHDNIDSPRIDTKENIKSYYDKHHLKLNQLSKDLVDNYGNCLILDCHSFNDSITINSPDICLGFNDLTTLDLKILTIIKEHFNSFGFTVAFNFPYIGSIYPSYYKNDNLQSIMVEINKKVYYGENEIFDVNKINNIRGVIISLYNKLLNL